INGIHSQPAIDRLRPPTAVSDTAIGTTNWATEAPMLPPAAFRPSAQPFSRAGKKKLMLAIDEAKLPPPSPARAAITNSTGDGVSGRFRQSARPTVGSNYSSAETTIQYRPPKRPTMKVYGNRMVAPTRLGSEISQKVCPVVRLKPLAGSIT